MWRMVRDASRRCTTGRYPGHARSLHLQQNCVNNISRLCKHSRFPMVIRKSGKAAPATATLRKGRAARKRASGPLNEEEIYRRIYSAVLDHRLQPGTKLKEVALAEVFGANRNVIRKVLTRLAYNRLVALRPNRGAVVASPSVEESRDLFAARRAVEAAIVDAVTRKIAPPEAKVLRALTATERDAYL